MIRVLVALSPRMYRQAIALSIQRGRPEMVDVRIAPPEAMEQQLASFRPHLLVCNDPRGDAHGGGWVMHRLEVIYTNGMDARLHADGTITELRDASVDDLLRAVDEAASLAEREGTEG
jgi:hypothetical protein